jgi:hypothetical protein
MFTVSTFYPLHAKVRALDIAIQELNFTLDMENDNISITFGRLNLPTCASRVRDKFSWEFYQTHNSSALFTELQVRDKISALGIKYFRRTTLRRLMYYFIRVGYHKGHA